MKRILLLVAVCVTVAGCTTQSRFVWGDYENSLYRYYKNPEHRERYRESLEKATAKGQEEDKVAPGLFAELGFLSLEDGDLDKSVGYFELEMKAFPESRLFLEGVIKKAREGQPASEDADLVSWKLKSEALT